MSTTTHLLTAEELIALPNDGVRRELVRGELVEMNVPVPRHGEICVNIIFALKSYLRSNALGRAATNDSGIVTERGPDSVRGPDVWYVSFKRIGPGPLPSTYLEVAPEIVFEVLSPSDRWSEVLAKVSEYLHAGVDVVCVADFEDETVHLYYDRKPALDLKRGDRLEFPNHLPGFSLPLTELFE
jgi:Uma2 family endonuclease